MKAYHGDPAIKEMYLKRLRMHREADELVKGRYWEHGKGCAVGCTIHSANHSAYETELEIPIKLARLEDVIFEGLENGLAQSLPERFLSAIPVGADLSMVWPRFALWLLADPAQGVIRFAGEFAQVREAIEGVLALYRRWVETGARPSAGEFREAAAEADAAARAAAAAADAADAAAWAAWATADAAAWAAAAARAWAAAADAARAARAEAAAAAAATWNVMAEKLLELLIEAPMVLEEAQG